ncbi:MAG TPA: GNAT family N-acetyltransferase [Steroidobacteraceae bacterium]|nr:GNAT family N-acetyltransferase [Steroidobacteraceae bacterium]
MNVRPAIAADARTVATVHVHTWQSAYRGIVPDSHLDSLSIDGRELVWGGVIEKGSPELWVAEVDSLVVGWSSFGASRDPDAGPKTGELEAIYVLPQYWKTGTGRALWLITRGRLIERGFATATLWVLADNLRAIRFYAAAGFAPNPASEKQINIGGRLLREIRYETDLGRT